MDCLPLARNKYNFEKNIKMSDTLNNVLTLVNEFGKFACVSILSSAI